VPNITEISNFNSYTWRLQDKLHNYEYIFTQHLYQLWKSDLHVVYLHELFCCPACVHVIKWPPCWVVNLVSVGIFWHALNNNQLVLLRGCLLSFMQINVKADLYHINPIWNIYIIWYCLSLILINSALMKHCSASWFEPLTFGTVGRLCYQLTYATSLAEGLILTSKYWHAVTLLLIHCC
jgi:hypothetical protein